MNKGKINISEINAGDFVVLKDKAGNVVAGECRYDGARWFVQAFATEIVFATVSTSVQGGRRRRVGVDVHSFNPPLPIDHE